MKRLAAACGRALAGAFAGLAVVGLVVLLVSDRGYGDYAEAKAFHRFVVRLLTGGAALGAAMAVLIGTARIGGRSGAVIKGMAYGGLVGVPSGALTATIVASIADIPAKAVIVLGIFAGLVLGAIVGGIVGSVLPAGPRGKSPTRLVHGVADRIVGG